MLSASAELSCCDCCRVARDGSRLPPLVGVQFGNGSARWFSRCTALRILLADAGDGAAPNAVSKSDNFRGVGAESPFSPGERGLSMVVGDGKRKEQSMGEKENDGNRDLC